MQNCQQNYFFGHAHTYMLTHCVISYVCDWKKAVAKRCLEFVKAPIKMKPSLPLQEGGSSAIGGNGTQLGDDVITQAEHCEVEKHIPLHETLN